MKISKKLRKEMADFESQREAEALFRGELIQRARDIYTEVEEDSRGINTLNHATFVGEMLFQADQLFGDASNLLLDWALDDYYTKVFHRNAYKFEDLYNYLAENGHTEKNQQDYNDCDNSMFYIPTDDSRLVMVVGGPQCGPDHLIVYEMEKYDDILPSPAKLMVRKVYPKYSGKFGETKLTLKMYKDCDFMKNRHGYIGKHSYYSDCRDSCNVISTGNDGRLEKTQWKLNNVKWFWFYLNVAWSRTDKFQTRCKICTTNDVQDDVRLVDKRGYAGYNPYHPFGLCKKCRSEMKRGSWKYHKNEILD